MQYIKKGLILTIIICMMCFFSVQSGYAEVIPINSLNNIEKMLFGSVQNDEIVNRIERIEKTLFQNVKDSSIYDRVTGIKDYVLGSDNTPSLMFQVNALEWSLTNSISQGSLIERVKNLESKLDQVLDKDNPAGLINRIKRLKEVIMSDKSIVPLQTTVPEGTPVKVKLLSNISSETTAVGDKFKFEVSQDVIINGKLVIPEKTEGNLEVTSVKKPSNFGRDGKIEYKISNLVAIDGTEIPLQFASTPGDDSKSQEMAVGASLIGAIVLNNPLGLAVGYFVQGKDANIPAGTVINFETKSEKEVNAFRIN